MMKFTKKQKNQLLKFRNALEDMFYNGKLRKYNVSLYDAEDARSVYNEICTHCEGTTLCGNVAKLFEKYGFNVSECGIGFRISI